MTTTDTVLLIIVACLLSLFFILSSVVVVLLIRVLMSVRRVVSRAENVVDSVEAAADVLKDAGGNLAVFKLIKNIVDLVQRKK